MEDVHMELNNGTGKTESEYEVLNNEDLKHKLIKLNVNNELNYRRSHDESGNSFHYDKEDIKSIANKYFKVFQLVNEKSQHDYGVSTGCVDEFDWLKNQTAEYLSSSYYGAAFGFSADELSFFDDPMFGILLDGNSIEEAFCRDYGLHSITYIDIDGNPVSQEETDNYYLHYVSQVIVTGKFRADENSNPIWTGTEIKKHNDSLATLKYKLQNCNFSKDSTIQQLLLDTFSIDIPEYMSKIHEYWGETGNKRYQAELRNKKAVKLYKKGAKEREKKEAILRAQQLSKERAQSEIEAIEEMYQNNLDEGGGY